MSSSGDPSSSSQANGMSYSNRNNQPSPYGSNVMPSIGAYPRGMSYLDTPPTPMRFPSPTSGFGSFTQQPNPFNAASPFPYNPYNSNGIVPTFSYYGQQSAGQFPAPGMNPFAMQPGMPPYHQQFGQQPPFGQPSQFGPSSQLPSDGQMPSMFSRSSSSKSEESGKKSSQ